MKFPDSELWNYSTQVYTLAGVENACLSLQNQYDADVNILLYCCWLGDRKYSLDENDISQLQTTTLPWQSTILKPLREARQMMKQHIIAIPAEQRKQTIDNMSEIELNAEHMAQLALEACIDLNERPVEENLSEVECSTQNLFVYLQQLDGVNSLNDITEAVTQLLNGIYGDEESVQMALMVAAAG